MSATPQAIARFTSDGVLLTAKNEVVRDRDLNAIDAGETEHQMFFNSAAHGALLLKERFSYLGMPGKPHEAVEFGDSLGLGTKVQILPRAPRAVLVDDTRRLSSPCVLRSYSFDMGSDSYACEFVGDGANSASTFDSTTVDFSATNVTWDGTRLAS